LIFIDKEAKIKIRLLVKLFELNCFLYSFLYDKAADGTDINLFDQEMKYLHDNGFKVISMSDIGYNENTKYMYIK